VDEVAAAHMNADSVVHFGHTCLTPSRTLPVLYIYTRLDLCVASLAKALSSLSLVLLVWDVQYNHLLEPWECPPSVIKAHCNQESEGILWLGRKVGVKCLKEVESATVVYVGRGEETLLGVVHTLPSNKVLHWEKNSLIPVGLAVTKLLMRRYFLVEKTKDASRIGLLVGTLGSQQCTEMLEKLRKVKSDAFSAPLGNVSFIFSPHAIGGESGRQASLHLLSWEAQCGQARQLPRDRCVCAGRLHRAHLHRLQGVLAACGHPLGAGDRLQQGLGVDRGVRDRLQGVAAWRFPLSTTK